MDPQDFWKDSLLLSKADLLHQIFTNTARNLVLHRWIFLPWWRYAVWDCSCQQCNTRHPWTAVFFFPSILFSLCFVNFPFQRNTARKMIKYFIQLIAWGYVCLLYSLQHVNFSEISAKPGSTNLRMDTDTAGVLHHKDKHGKQYYTTTSAL